MLAAWYNSFQHEVIHGHPTPWPRLNRLLASIPLSLITPLATYRLVHIAHHRCQARLTDPTVDPESFSVTAETWASSGRVQRSLLWVMQTVPGRLLFGPLVLAVRTWRQHRLLHGPAAVRVGLKHLVGVGARLGMVAASRVSLATYVVGTVWGGGALSLLRSFAEHRAVEAGTRSAVVRSGRFFSLLYLNNNLHHTHHARPGAPWYTLPRLAAELESDAAARTGAGWYRGYGSIVRRHWLRPLVSPVYRPAAISGGSATGPSVA